MAEGGILVALANRCRCVPLVSGFVAVAGALMSAASGVELVLMVLLCGVSTIIASVVEGPAHALVCRGELKQDTGSLVFC